MTRRSRTCSSACSPSSTCPSTVVRRQHRRARDLDGASRAQPRAFIEHDRLRALALLVAVAGQSSSWPDGRRTCPARRSPKPRCARPRRRARAARGRRRRQRHGSRRHAGAALARASGRSRHRRAARRARRADVDATEPLRRRRSSSQSKPPTRRLDALAIGAERGRRAGTRGEPPPLQACARRRTPTLRARCSSTAQRRRRARAGFEQTALMIAAREGTGVRRSLLDAEADVDASDAPRAAALHSAQRVAGGAVERHRHRARRLAGRPRQALSSRRLQDRALVRGARRTRRRRAVARAARREPRARRRQRHHAAARRDLERERVSASLAAARAITWPSRTCCSDAGANVERDGLVRRNAALGRRRPAQPRARARREASPVCATRRSR